MEGNQEDLALLEDDTSLLMHDAEIKDKIFSKAKRIDWKMQKKSKRRGTKISSFSVKILPSG